MRPIVQIVQTQCAPLYGPVAECCRTHTPRGHSADTPREDILGRHTRFMMAIKPHKSLSLHSGNVTCLSLTCRAALIGVLWLGAHTGELSAWIRLLWQRVRISELLLLFLSLAAKCISQNSPAEIVPTIDLSLFAAFQ